MSVEELVEAEEAIFDCCTDGGTGAEVFGSFEEGDCVGDEVLDVGAVRCGEVWAEIVEAAKEIIVDFVVRRIASANSVGVLRDQEGLLRGEVLGEISYRFIERFNLFKLWYMERTKEFGYGE